MYLILPSILKNLINFIVWLRLLKVVHLVKPLSCKLISAHTRFSLCSAATGARESVANKITILRTETSEHFIPGNTVLNV